MLDFSKVVTLIKKELPSSTDEQIDYMISTIPPSTPYILVKNLVKLTKHLVDNPAKRKLLRSQKLKLEENVPKDV